MKRLVPASRAAASRASVPSVRSRLVSAKVRSSFLEKPRPASAVAWWMIASGLISRMARRTAPGSSRSSATGCAPSTRTRSALPGDLNVPITSCPRAVSWGTSREPIAPLAPMTMTRMILTPCHCGAVSCASCASPGRHPAARRCDLVRGDAFAQPAADALDGLVSLGKKPGEGVPAMRHLVPHLQRDLDAGGAGPGGQPGGVVEEDLGVADVDEDRRQAPQVGVDR